MAFLVTDTFDVIGTRDIPAPLDEAWKSWTDSEFVLQWWGHRLHLHGRRDGCAGRRPLAGVHERTGLGLPGALQHLGLHLGRRPEPARVRPQHVRRAGTEEVEGIPRDVRHVITFEAVSPEVTRLTVHESSYPTAEARDQSSQGLKECLDKLVAIYA